MQTHFISAPNMRSLSHIMRCYWPCGIPTPNTAAIQTSWNEWRFKEREQVQLTNANECHFIWRILALINNTSCLHERKENASFFSEKKENNTSFFLWKERKQLILRVSLRGKKTMLRVSLKGKKTILFSLKEKKTNDTSCFSGRKGKNTLCLS